MKFVFLLIAMMPFAVMAQAFEGVDTSQPISIDADSLEVLQKDQKAIFRGNVIATQGKIRLKSQAMTVHYRDGNSAGGGNNVSRIDVEGGVVLATPTESAQGSKGVYDVDKKEIRLLGDVVLTRDKNVLKGSSLNYNLATGKSLLSGGVQSEQSGGGRVRGLFVPNKTQ